MPWRAHRQRRLLKSKDSLTLLLTGRPNGALARTRLRRLRRVRCLLWWGLGGGLRVVGFDREGPPS